MCNNMQMADALSTTIEDIKALQSLEKSATVLVCVCVFVRFYSL